jgi:glycosyltransferase involved in cell wall biosynthesis
VQIFGASSQHHLFLFPTRGENFGHVIHEALRAGLPLLISDQTPWQRLAEQGVGWDLPLDDMRAFARRIEEVARWPQAVRDQYSTRASDLAVKVGQDELTLEANRRLFLDAIARRR